MTPIFVKGDTNGKEKNSKGTVEQRGSQSAQKVVSRYRHFQNRKKDGTKDRRRKEESVKNGSEKIKGLSKTHRQGIASRFTRGLARVT